MLHDGKYDYESLARMDKKEAAGGKKAQLKAFAKVAGTALLKVLCTKGSLFILFIAVAYFSKESWKAQHAKFKIETEKVFTERKLEEMSDWKDSIEFDAALGKVTYSFHTDEPCTRPTKAVDEIKALEAKVASLVSEASKINASIEILNKQQETCRGEIVALTKKNHDYFVSIALLKKRAKLIKDTNDNTTAAAVESKHVSRLKLKRS